MPRPPARHSVSPPSNVRTKGATGRYSYPLRPLSSGCRLPDLERRSVDVRIGPDAEAEDVTAGRESGRLQVEDISREACVVAEVHVGVRIPRVLHVRARVVRDFSD